MIEQARLHPDTVTKISEGKHGRPRARPRARSNRNSRIQELTVRPEVWAEVLRILNSGHGYTKTTIHSETEVTVR